MPGVLVFNLSDEAFSIDGIGDWVSVHLNRTGIPKLKETLSPNRCETPNMKGKFLRPLLACYRGLPEWLVRSLVFSLVGLAFGAGVAFLLARSAFRQIQATWTRLRS